MTVSCIIPVYNGERYLDETLRSVLDQSYQDTEVIVVDDGSTDQTRAVVESFEGKVSYLYQQNAGDVRARNHGIEHTTGEFVAFLDADDLWKPEKLQLQMERFEARPELELCLTMVETFWSEDVPAESRVETERTNRLIPGYTTSAMLAKRELFHRFGSVDTTLSHAADTQWFLACREAGVREELIQNPLLLRRLHALNKSRHKANTSRDEYLSLIKAKLDRQRAARAVSKKRR